MRAVQAELLKDAERPVGGDSRLGCRNVLGELGAEGGQSRLLQVESGSFEFARGVSCTVRTVRCAPGAYGLR